MTSHSGSTLRGSVGFLVGGLILSLLASCHARGRAMASQLTWDGRRDHDGDARAVAADASMDVSESGNAADASMPVEVAYGEVLAATRGAPCPLQGIALGSGFRCMLDTRGTVRCAGSNTRGECGVEHVERVAQPVTVPEVVNATRVVASLAYACAVTARGELWCWGESPDVDQTLPGARRGVRRRSPPHRVLGFYDVVDVTVLNNAVCAVSRGGEVRCVGRFYPISGASEIVTRRPVRVLRVPAGARFTFSTGLSLGYVSDRGVITQDGLATQAARDAVHIAVVSDACCQLLPSRLMTCWGRDLCSSERSSAIAPGIRLDGVTMFGVAMHGCALHGDGTVSCWGRNEYGEAGVVPERSAVCSEYGMDIRVVRAATVVPGIREACQLGVGPFQSCAARYDGELLCWGFVDGGIMLEPTAVPR